MTSLAATAASQSLAAAYSLRKVNPAYAGSCMRVINSLSNQQDIGFDANGNVNVSAMTTFANLGNGTLKLYKWYDQSGNARDLAGAGTLPILFNAITNAASVQLPAGDFNNTTYTLSTTGTFLNVGGTNNLSILCVAAAMGYAVNSGAMTRPGTYATGYHSLLLGYGVSATAMVHAAYGANAETAMYAKEGELFVEDGAPSTGRVRNFWFNQAGATVSGGADTRTLWSGRAHGIAGAASQKLTLGTRFNGQAYEILIYNAAGALSDTECEQIANWQRDYWGSLGAANYPTRFYPVVGGQSNLQNAFSTGWTSSGLAADQAWPAQFEPDFKSLMNFAGNPLYELATPKGNLTAIGGSTVLKPESVGPAPNSGAGPWPIHDGVDVTKKFWWDQQSNIPGPLYWYWKRYATDPAYTLIPGHLYRNICFVWSQGESDAANFTTSTGGASYTTANWKACTKLLLAQMRAEFGMPSAPIVIAPLGRFGSNDVKMRVLRLLQAEIAAEVTNCFLAPDTTIVDMNSDQTHYEKPPANTNGFTRDMKQVARAVAYAFGSTTTVYRGPVCASYSVSGANSIDVNLTWPQAGGGNDFATRDGSTTGIVGFEITDSVGLRTITAAVRQTASSIRLTVSGAALSGITAVNYNPQPYALNPAKMVVDNNASYGLPLQAAQSIALAVSASLGDCHLNGSILISQSGDAYPIIGGRCVINNGNVTHLICGNKVIGIDGILAGTLQ